MLSLFFHLRVNTRRAWPRTRTADRFLTQSSSSWCSGNTSEQAKNAGVLLIHAGGLIRSTAAAVKTLQRKKNNKKNNNIDTIQGGTNQNLLDFPFFLVAA